MRPPTLDTADSASMQPNDAYSLVQLVYLLYGIGVLLPWNIILSCLDFLQEKMPDYQPASTYPFAANILLCFMQVMTVIYGFKISFSVRLVTTYLGLAAFLVAVPFFADVGGKFAYTSVFILCLIYGFFCGICQCTVFQMGGQMPAKYMGAIMAGNGIGGLGTNLIRAATLKIWPVEEDPKNSFRSALFMFMMGAIVMVFCAVTQLYLRTNRFSKYHLKPYSGYKKTIDATPTPAPVRSESESTQGEGTNLLNKTPSTATTINGEKSGLRLFFSQAYANFQATQGLLIALTYVFLLTFVCFPGLADDSYFSFLAGNKEEDSWYNLLCILIFNAFDLIGRYSGGASCFDLPRKTVLVMSGCRTIFIVTFLLVAFEVSPSWLFQADWFKLTNYALFSFTNGYTSTLCAIKAPQTVEGQQKGQVGAFVGVTISLGILLGSVLALGMGKVLLLTPKEKAS